MLKMNFSKFVHLNLFKHQYFNYSWETKNLSAQTLTIASKVGFLTMVFSINFDLFQSL